MQNAENLFLLHKITYINLFQLPTSSFMEHGPLLPKQSFRRLLVDWEVQLTGQSTKLMVELALLSTKDLLQITIHRAKLWKHLGMQFRMLSTQVVSQKTLMQFILFCHQGINIHIIKTNILQSNWIKNPLYSNFSQGKALDCFKCLQQSTPSKRNKSNLYSHINKARFKNVVVIYCKLLDFKILRTFGSNHLHDYILATVYSTQHINRKYLCKR